MLVKRKTRTGSNNLNITYRPCTVNELLGNDINKKIIQNDLDKQRLSHTLLFCGPSGCGKTTAARIIALSLNCQDFDNMTSKPCLKCASCKAILEGCSMDVQEVNVGKEGGKAAVSDIVDSLDTSPFNSRYKVIIFDEAHKLTAAAKDLLLKPTEDGYSHVYFIFCTNKPDELKSNGKGGDAFLARCSKLHFNPLSDTEIEDLLTNVAEFEGEVPDKAVITRIVNEIHGIPRDALMILNSVISEGSWNIKAVDNLLGTLIGVDDPQIIELSRTLAQGTWKKSCTLYASLSKKMNTETIRIAISGYFVSCLKRSNKVKEARKFSAILDILAVPIYVTGKLAEQLFYNMMFKIIDLVTIEKTGRR